MARRVPPACVAVSIRLVPPLPIGAPPAVLPVGVPFMISCLPGWCRSCCGRCLRVVLSCFGFLDRFLCRLRVVPAAASARHPRSMVRGPALVRCHASQRLARPQLHFALPGNIVIHALGRPLPGALEVLGEVIGQLGHLWATQTGPQVLQQLYYPIVMG